VMPSVALSSMPSDGPTISPASMPSSLPSTRPSSEPSSGPSVLPSVMASVMPSFKPSDGPSISPSSMPSSLPSALPSQQPTVCQDEPGWEVGGTSDFAGMLCADINGNSDGWCELLEGLNDDTSHEGKVISEACCDCGGGDHQIVFPSSSPSIQPSVSPKPSLPEFPSTVPSSQPTMCRDEPGWHFPVETSSGTTLEVACAWLGDNSNLCANFRDRYFQAKNVFLACCICGGADHLSVAPSSKPSNGPSISPSSMPSSLPSTRPSSMPSLGPSALPSVMPSVVPSSKPSDGPSISPSLLPSILPSLMPSSRPSVTCLQGESLFEIELQADSYYNETAYILQGIVNGTPVSKDLVRTCLSGPDITEHKCLPDNKCYRFTITDLAGDGICCNYGNGWYNLRYRGTEFKHSSFEGGSNEVTSFGDDCSSPSVSPSTIPSSALSNQPSISRIPSLAPSVYPSTIPSSAPSNLPSFIP